MREDGSSTVSAQSSATPASSSPSSTTPTSSSPDQPYRKLYHDTPVREHYGRVRDRACKALSEVIQTEALPILEIPKSVSYYSYDQQQQRRRRGVCHRNAEEALSSLLWQPYECRAPPSQGSGPPLSASRSSGHSLAEPRYGESCVPMPTMRLSVPVPPADTDSGACVTSDSVIVTSASVQVHQPSRTWTTSAAQTDDPAPPAPPPYSTLPPSTRLGPPPPPPPPPPPTAVPAIPLQLPFAQPAIQPHPYPFQPVTLRRCQYGEESEDTKTCCGGGGGRLVSLKWFIVAVALAGVCCVLVGAVLGAAGAHGRAHLTVLLLMICIGFVLVFVSGAAWRAISKRARARARSGSLTTSSPPRRLPSTSCARAHHPYAAMLYPEFHCRPPPPSYQASMHEYRLSRLLLLDRGASPPMACPPPPYRPRPRGLVGGGPPYLGGRGARSRRRAEPRESPAALSAVVIQNIGLEQYDDVKYDDSQEVDQPIGSDRKEEEVQQEHKEGNLVTIVQTGQDTSPVIVTVSGSIPEARPNQAQHTSEIDILAHL